MSINRKDFIKKSCLTGIIACGAAPMSMACRFHLRSDEQDKTSVNPCQMHQEWAAILLQKVSEKLPEEELGKILKECSAAHYNKLEMDKMLSPYKGKMDDFLVFLQNEWNWKIDYDKEKGIIVADENKNYCVCPMVNKDKGIESSLICYCSEGFAEMMFSVVIGRNVKAKVLTSVLRGDPTCRYQIKIS